MLVQIDYAALASYALDTFDFSEEFEDDAFAIDFQGERVFVRRKRDHFAIEVGEDTLLLPRC